MNGKRGPVHAVLRTSKLCQVRAAPSQHRVAIVLQTQTEAPVVFHQRVGAAQQGVHRVVEGAGELLAAATERAPVKNRSREPLNLRGGEFQKAQSVGILYYIHVFSTFTVLYCYASNDYVHITYSSTSSEIRVHSD